MATHRARMIGAPSTTTDDGYKRHVVCAHEAAPSQPTNDLDNESLEESSEDEEEEEEDSSARSETSSDEESQDETNAPPALGYARCPPSRDIRIPDQSDAPTWSAVGEGSFPTSPATIRSIRSSDTLSIASSRRSLPTRHQASATHK
jgi:hypothetical protein